MSSIIQYLNFNQFCRLSYVNEEIILEIWSKNPTSIYGTVIREVPKQYEMFFDDFKSFYEYMKKELIEDRIKFNGDTIAISLEPIINGKKIKIYSAIKLQERNPDVTVKHLFIQLEFQKSEQKQIGELQEKRFLNLETANKNIKDKIKNMQDIIQNRQLSQETGKFINISKPLFIIQNKVDRPQLKSWKNSIVGTESFTIKIIYLEGCMLHFGCFTEAEKNKNQDITGGGSPSQESFFVIVSKTSLKLFNGGIQQESFRFDPLKANDTITMFVNVFTKKFSYEFNFYKKTREYNFPTYMSGNTRTYAFVCLTKKGIIELQ